MFIHRKIIKNNKRILSNSKQIYDVDNAITLIKTFDIN